MKIRKPDEYYSIFEKEKLVGYDAILLIARDLFFSRGFLVSPGKWEAFIASLDQKKKEKLGDMVYFYYYVGRPWEANDGSHTIRDESRIVATISMMEAMMSTEKHLTFFDWFKKSYPGKNTIEDLEVAKGLYLKDFGVHRKFKEYLERYLVGQDGAIFFDNIEIFENSKFRPLKGNDEAATLLYAMRSSFVHSAKMSTFCSPKSLNLTSLVGKNTYRFLVDVEDYLILFEKSFAEYWLAVNEKL